MPALSRLQNDDTRYAAAGLRVMRLLSLICFPIAGGLVVLAEEAVVVAYGSQWVDAVPIFRVLCVAGLWQSWIGFSGTFFVSKGKTRELFLLGTLSSTALVLGMLPCIWYGGIGAATGYAVVSGLTTPLL